MSPRPTPAHRSRPPRRRGFVLVALALLAALLALAAPAGPAGAAPADPTPTAAPAGGRLRLAAGVGQGAGELAGAAATPVPAVGTPARAAVACVERHAGVCYDPKADTTGAKQFYQEWVTNNGNKWPGITRPDAEKIALAHTKAAWLRGKKPLTASGFDMAAVNQYDEHAARGDDGKEYDHETQTWGSTFRPVWGRDSAPEISPGRRAGENAAGAAGDQGGLTPGPQVDGGGGGVALFNPVEAVREAIASLDWKTIVGGLFSGVWDATFDDQFRAEVQKLAGWLLANPDLTGGGGQMGNIQELAGQFQWAGRGLALLIFTVLVLQSMAGGGLPLGEVVGRMLVVVAALGLYRWLVGRLTDGTNELSATILATGTDEVTTFGSLLEVLLAATPIFHRLVALAGFVCVVALIVVKTFGVVLLILAYVAGPLFLPLAIHPGAGRWAGLWAEHFLKALLWPVIFALEFRVFGALTGGISFTNEGGFDLKQGLLQILVAVACLAIIASTPWAVHTQFTVARGVALARAQRARGGGAAGTTAQPAARQGAAREGQRPPLVATTAREAATPPARLRRVV